MNKHIPGAPGRQISPRLGLGPPGPRGEQQQQPASSWAQELAPGCSGIKPHPRAGCATALEQNGCMRRDARARARFLSPAASRPTGTALCATSHFRVSTLALLGIPGGQHQHPPLPLPITGPSGPAQGPRAPSNRHRGVLVLLAESLQPASSRHAPRARAPAHIF